MAFKNFTSSNPTGHTPNNNSNNNAGSNSTPNNPFSLNNPYGGSSDTGEAPESLINYNEKFKDANPIQFRDDVIAHTIAVLLNKKKPNPILIGEAGVGKTQVVEEIARMIANNDPLIPNELKDYTIYEMPLSGLTAGTSFRGQMEQYVKDLIDFAQDPENKAIIFIDEFHTVLKYDEVSQAIKPAMARGDMRLISATTLQEANDLRTDPAINRRTTRVLVDELTPAQTVSILKSAYENSLFEHHGKEITVADELFPFIVDIADRNKIDGSHRPDNALTLLDNAMSNLRIDRYANVKKATEDNDTQLLQLMAARKTQPLRKSFVEQTAESMRTGKNRIATDIDGLDSALTRIKGQDHIVKNLKEDISRAMLNLFPTTKPKSMLYVGPSGVGKTEIAKIIAQQVTGLDPIIINMPEYNSSATLNNIIGSPMGYVGSTSKQELPFDTLTSNPKRVILLDEFEKGNIAVQRLFMGALDNGYIKTNRGTTVDFSQTIIIATTNAGQTDAKTNTIGFTQPDKDETKVDYESLKGHFDRELINRFGQVVQFNELTKDDYEQILIDTYTRERAVAQAKTAYDIPEKLDREVLNAWLNDYDPKSGARPAERLIKAHIENVVIEQMTSHTL